MNTRSVTVSLTGKLLLAFVLVPLVELTLLVQLYQRTSFFMTLLVAVFTGILGVSLARRQGLDVWHDIHQQLAQGKNPSTEIMNGVMILLAGAFLMTPGLLTDGVGFALLVPWFRNRLRIRLANWFRKRTIVQFGGSRSGDPFQQQETPAEDQASVRVVDPHAEKSRSGDIVD